MHRSFLGNSLHLDYRLYSPAERETSRASFASTKLDLSPKKVSEPFCFEIMYIPILSWDCIVLFGWQAKAQELASLAEDGQNLASLGVDLAKKEGAVTRCSSESSLVDGHDDAIACKHELPKRY